MQTTLEALTWARENITAIEAACDMLSADPGEVIVPTLPAPERELESLLLACLQVRPGGLDRNTPSRTREWLWRGLSGVMAGEVLGRQGGIVATSPSSTPPASSAPIE